MRRAARVDSNQAEIVKALREAGCVVEVLSSVGKIVDLAVGYQGVVHWVEVKNMDGRGDKLTPDEQAFFDRWEGYPVHIVRNIAQAFDAVGVEWSV